MCADAALTRVHLHARPHFWGDCYPQRCANRCEFSEVVNLEEHG